LVLRYRITNRANRSRDIRFVVYEVLRINESPFYNTALFDQESGGLVFYFRDIAIATTGTAKVAGYQCGVLGEGSSALKGSRLNLAGSSIQHKDPDGAVAWGLGRLGPGADAEITLYISAATTIRDAIQRVTKLSRLDTPTSKPAGDGAQGANQLRGVVEETWREWLMSNQSSAGSGERSAGCGDRLKPRIKVKGIVNRRVQPDLMRKLGTKGQELYWRSLLTLKLLSDRDTGAIIAAPEFDREREACGGYGYCWGRDGAFNAYALGSAGMLEEAEAFFEFARLVQEPDGVWLHRHYAGGDLAPSWGLIQIDETGAILWAVHEHYKMTGSRAFLKNIWDSISRAADYLGGSIDDETGLPQSYELWEEQLCESVYSAAAVCGGFRAGAGCAAALGKRAEVRAWNRRAEQMREAIARVLWDPRAKSFLKSVKKSISESEFKQAAAIGGPECYVEVADGQHYPEFIQVRDSTTDSSQLGLAFPFEVLEPGDKMMKQAARAVSSRLWSRKTGGIMRYERDRYVGGNAWILTTLWLAIYYLDAGMTRQAVPLIKWAIDHATESGLLTEQVDKRTGKPTWAVPLGWSHAMYVIAALKLDGK
jgi:hypothetical protein